MSLDVIKTTRGAAPAKLDFAMLVSYTLPHESRKANTHDNDKNAAGEWVKVAPPKGTPGQVDQGAPSSGGAGHDWAKAPASAYAWEPLPR